MTTDIQIIQTNIHNAKARLETLEIIKAELLSDNESNADEIETALASVQANIMKVDNEIACLNIDMFGLTRADDGITALTEQSEIESIVFFYDGNNDDIYTMQVNTPTDILTTDISYNELCDVLDHYQDVLDWHETDADNFTVTILTPPENDDELTDEERHRQDYEAYLEERWEESRWFSITEKRN